MLVAVIALQWSWLLVVDVGRVSSSAILGYAILAFGYLVIVGLTAFIASLASKWLKPSLAKPSWQNVLKLLIVWAAVELVIAWAVSVVWMGRNGNWDNIAPFYSLTPIIMMTPLKFLARFFGFFGTSAVIGSGLVLLFRKNYQRYAAVYWGSVLVLSFVSWGVYKTPSGMDTTVTIVSEKLGETGPIETGNSTFALLPEYGLDDYTNENITTRIKGEKDVFFSGTKQQGGFGATRNVLVYGSSQKGFMVEQDKSRLIIAGEYLPFMVEALLRASRSPVYEDFMIRRSVVPGNQSLKPFEVTDGLILGNAACSSIINTEDYRKLTRDGASVLANSASLEVFRGSRLFGLYHDGFAKFMATANARPFLQSANNWKAFALDHNGNTLASVSPTGTKDLTIQTNDRKTPYTYLGEWVALVGGLYIARELTVSLYKKLVRNRSKAIS